MPVVYETVAELKENGHLLLSIDDLPFEKGTNFVVKLIPQPLFDAEDFKQKMRSLTKKFAEQNPYKGMTEEQVLAELRKQRESMYDD
jgi:hypothetical protein